MHLKSNRNGFELPGATRIFYIPFVSEVDVWCLTHFTLHAEYQIDRIVSKHWVGEDFLLRYDNQFLMMMVNQNLDSLINEASNLMNLFVTNIFTMTISFTITVQLKQFNVKKLLSNSEIEKYSNSGRIGVRY